MNLEGPLFCVGDRIVHASLRRVGTIIAIDHVCTTHLHEGHCEGAVSRCQWMFTGNYRVQFEETDERPLLVPEVVITYVGADNA